MTEQSPPRALGLASEPPAKHSGVALLGMGFRPFFLLAAAYAVAPMVIWLLEYGPGMSITAGWGGMFFHGHEMVFGFTSAAIAGFLLTAVPNWTGATPVRGAPLLGLAALWIAGRAAMALSAHVAPVVVALLDLAFYPALIAALTPSIVRARQRRNIFAPVILLFFLLGNVIAHLGMLRANSDLTRFGLHLGAYLAAILILIIGNRVIPMFTINALRRAGSIGSGSSAPARLGAGVFALSIVALGLDLASSPRWLVGSVSAIAGLAISWRLFGWRGAEARRMPLVWVLHVGYGFVALGFLSLATNRLLDVPPWSAAFHLFTSGAIGTMVLGMMSRVALGHTGRPLAAPRSIAIAYGLVIGGALVRSLAPAVSPTITRAGVVVGGVIWVLGYLIFLVVYAPILVSPRVDRRPG